MPMVVLTKITLVGTVDRFKIEQEERDSGQVETKSLWKGFVAKRSREMGLCLSVCLSVQRCVISARSFESQNTGQKKANVQGSVIWEIGFTGQEQVWWLGPN